MDVEETILVAEEISRPHYDAHGITGYDLIFFRAASAVEIRVDF
jgi:hypothetical protein